MSETAYPANCRPLNESLQEDELIRRLKVLSASLQTMSQEEGLNQKYIPLAYQLAEDHFLNNPSRDVRLFVGCCIADILRVFAPEAPYKNPSQIKTIFMFLITQLEGLRDPKETTFKRYFYLLENLAYVKSFNMCFEIEDNQEVFFELFNTMFKIVNDDQNAKVKSFMLDIMSPLITESDSVSFDLLDVILIHIIEPNKSTKKPAYNLAKEIIIKTSDSLAQYFQTFLSSELLSDRREKNYQSTAKIFDLIYELFTIAPSALSSILPHLECKLRSTDENDRLKTISLLAKMFSDKDSTLIADHPQLWRQFKGRFSDISRAVRKKCVQSAMLLLLNHEDLRPQIVEMLRSRYRDSDEQVRYEVVIAIVETAKRDWKIVAESELLDFIKERVMDMKFKIRKEAMTGFSIIYKKYMCAVENGEELDAPLMQAASMIKNKILHGYYMTNTEDKILIERLLITCLIPYQLPTEERMKVLYHLLSTIDENASKAFIELHKNQLKLRKIVSDWIRVHKKELTIEVKKELTMRTTSIAKQLPEPTKAQEYLLKFSVHMRKDPQLINDMDVILRRDVSCKECTDTMSSVLKKLGNPCTTNFYFNTIKLLLSRVASVIVDNAAIEEMLGLIEKCIEAECRIGMKKRTSSNDITSTESDDEERKEDPTNIIINNLSPLTAGESGVKLLAVLSTVFSTHFQSTQTLKKMVALLGTKKHYVAANVLKAFTSLALNKPLIESHPSVLEELAPLCKNYALTGNSKESKHAIRCMFLNTQQNLQQQNNNVQDRSDWLKTIDIFQDIVDSFEKVLVPENENYRTSIVSLGHISYHLPERFNCKIKSIISRKIVKELLLSDTAEERDDVPNTSWCEVQDLPEYTRCRVEGLKAMARWLIGLKKHIETAQKTFRMFDTFIHRCGDVLLQKRLSTAEKSWLRLSAGKAVLKICEQKGVGDQLSAEQFYNLSHIMYDDSPEVREAFVKKLHKGLSKGIPDNCLPVDYLGLYALGGRETNKKLLTNLKTYIQDDVNLRRKYIKTFPTIERARAQVPHIFPDYMLVYGIAVLAHDPKFTEPMDVLQLTLVEKCLWLIMEPLVSNKEFFCYSFYKKVLERIKHHKSALKPDDELTNRKLWAICDIAMTLLKQPTVTGADNASIPDDQQIEARIPVMLFKAQPADFRNNKCYLPANFLTCTTNPIAPAALSAQLGYQSDPPYESEGRSNGGTSRKRTNTNSSIDSDKSRQTDDDSEDEEQERKSTNGAACPLDEDKDKDEDEDDEPPSKKRLTRTNS